MRVVLGAFAVLMVFGNSGAFFTSNSVSLSERATSVFTNPAGLSVQAGNEFLFGINVDSTGKTEGWSLAVALKNIGLGYSSHPAETLITLTEGFKFGESYHIGYGITWLNREPSWNFGILVRPIPWVSFGATTYKVKRGRKPNFAFGLGLRPLTDRITLDLDLPIRPGEDIDKANYSFKAGVEPIDGIFISLSQSKNKQWRVGLDLSLGRVSLSSQGEKDGSKSFEFLSSRKPYRSSFFKRKRVVELKLSGSYPEERGYRLFGGLKPSFLDLLRTFKSLEKDDRVEGVLIKWVNPRLGFAQLEELRNSLERLKNSGKEIVVYAEQLSGSEYYALSPSDKIILVPTSTLLLLGLRSEVMFFKGTMDKLGIKAQFARVGKYKSAVEPFTRDSLSQPAKEQISDLLDDMYDLMISGISKGRGLTKDSVEKLIDWGAFSAEEAWRAGLIDTFLYESQLDSLLESEFGKAIKTIPSRKFKEETPYRVSWKQCKPKIAVIAAEGGIVTGKSTQNPLTGKLMGSETIAKAIKKAAKDKSIKAIVLRVNSPGGSGLASDIILKEIENAKKEKPVIVSMGNVAASGGYFISMNANEIVADKSTITGSIGVLGGKFVLRNLYRKLGLNKEIIKRGKHADAFSDWRPFTEDEEKRLQELIDDFYWDFVEKVAKNRKKTKDEIHKVAQGRVWSGLRALRVGLVDTLGGLLDAIEIAKERAGIPKERDVGIVMLPQKRGILGFLKVSSESLIKDQIKEELSPEWLEGLKSANIYNLFTEEPIILLMPYLIEVK